jgi:peptidoglycan/LPS O-acetylase OafA/YrhL
MRYRRHDRLALYPGTLGFGRTALSKRSRSVFSTLDGLRGLAALAVMARHAPDHTFLNLLPGSALAVDLFFVFSGFVLAHSYTERLRGGMGAMAFRRVRFIRLYPLYILGTALVAANLALVAHFDYHAWFHLIGSAVSAGLFLPTPPGISPDAHPFPLNFPAWSLFFELVINYVFALLLPRLNNRLLAGVILIGLAMLIVTGVHFGGLNTGVVFSNFWGGGGRVVFSFFAGVAVYRFWQSGHFTWIAFPAPVALAILVTVFVAEPINEPAIYDLFATIIVFPILVLAAARKEPAGFFVGICEQLGLASYAIYVMQVPVIKWYTWMSYRFFGHGPADFGLAGTISVMVVVTALALFLDKAYDPKARDMLSSLFQPKEPASSSKI